MGRANGKITASWVSLRENYDPVVHLELSLQSPPLPGAVRTSLSSFDKVRQTIADNPDCLVVISDIHAQKDLLINTLHRAGIVDENGARIRPSGVLLFIGDVVDGRDPADLETFRYVRSIADVILAGNHEAALMGGKTFGGLDFIDPEVKREIESAARSGELDAAYAYKNTLVTHAGVNVNHFSDKDPAVLAEKINEEFLTFFYRNSHQPGSLFDNTSHGGRGGNSDFGGVFWQDFEQLLQNDMRSGEYRQITGHSALGGIEQDPAGDVFCVDVGGSRLGVCVITPDEDLVFADSHLSN